MYRNGFSNNKKVNFIKKIEYVFIVVNELTFTIKL
jgi:hypothetical protein